MSKSYITAQTAAELANARHLDLLDEGASPAEILEAEEEKLRTALASEIDYEQRMSDRNLVGGTLEESVEAMIRHELEAEQSANRGQEMSL